MASDVNFEAIAEKTSGFTGADLQNIVDTAADRAIARSLKQGAEDPISQADLLGALKEVKPTSFEWLTTARNYARYANESGHYDDVLAFIERNSRG
jgi:SpoVK/Ycf46/Vps4 family AAA+-type ATPase